MNSEIPQGYEIPAPKPLSLTAGDVILILAIVNISVFDLFLYIFNRILQ